jgi:hypothetical protein
MRKLLLSLMILFALIALPAGAQNETKTESAEGGVVDLPSEYYSSEYYSSEYYSSEYYSSEYYSSDGAFETDTLTQGIFEGDPERSLSYSLSEEFASSDQPFASEGISGEGAINNLDSLSNSSGSEPGAGGYYNDVAAENTGQANNSGQILPEELNEMISAFDQSEAMIWTEEDLPLGGRTLTRLKSRRTSLDGRDANVPLGDQTLAPIQGEIMKIFEQSDLRSGSDGKNNLISDFPKNDLMDAVEQFRNGPVGYTGIEDQSPESESRNTRDPYLDFLSNLELIKGVADGTNVTDPNIRGIFLEMNSQFDTLQNPGSKDTDDQTILSYLSPFTPSDIIRIETPYLADFSIKDEDDEPKNYAVVVGINQYSDRRNLRASVNDAEEMARILRELYGYEVIMLTDKTENRPPTKHNILEGALAEIRAKQNRGDVLVYFSGHGEIDGDGNFYLIPKDADANPTSYISEDELNRYIKDIKGLSLIVDACYSGKLYNNSESQPHYSGLQRMGEKQEQWILTSSKEDEPSNEMWNETNSVFTYYLCQAIKDEAKKSGRLPLQISLQSCFNSVQDKTVRWSSSNFLSQTPLLNPLQPKE